VSLPPMNLSLYYNNNTDAVVTHCAQYNNNNLIHVFANNKKIIIIEIERVVIFFISFSTEGRVYFIRNHILYIIKSIYRALYQKNNNIRHVKNFKAE